MRLLRRSDRAIAIIVLAITSSTSSVLAQAPPSPATPAEMVDTYSTLADAILAVRKSETNMVRSILATTRGHAEAEMARARAALKAGDARTATAAVEAVAAYVGQLGTEGDNAVAGVRKRLVEGGHHHNAAGEQKGIYDEGFVVVTRTAKQAFLEASKAIGQMAKAPTAEGLEAEWKKVAATYDGLMKSAR